MCSNLNTEYLSHQIEAAFPESLIPLGDSIVINPSDWEGSSIAEFFKGKFYRELSIDELANTYYPSLWFFTPSAFQYYIPAFMLAELNVCSDSRYADNLGVNVLARFASLENGEQIAHLKEQVKILTTDQCKAVIGFLAYLGQKYGYPDEKIQQAVDVIKILREEKDDRTA